MSNNIPNFKQENEIARKYYKDIFAALTPNATLRDALEKMLEKGNTPWFKKWPNYFLSKRMESFQTTPEDPLHSSLHLILGASHTMKGEASVLLLQNLLKGDNNKKSLITSLKSDISINSPMFLYEEYIDEPVNAFKLESDLPLTSKTNRDFCRIILQAVFALKHLTKESGLSSSNLKNLNKDGKESYLSLPASIFNPHEIMFDLDMKYVNFTRKAITPSPELQIPENEIKLIEQVCEAVNKFENGKMLRF